jgi:hypothetical protein
VRLESYTAADLLAVAAVLLNQPAGRRPAHLLSPAAPRASRRTPGLAARGLADQMVSSGSRWIPYHIDRGVDRRTRPPTEPAPQSTDEVVQARALVSASTRCS